MDVCIDTSKGERERDSVCDDWACWELILYKKFAGNVLRTSSTVMDSVGRTLMNAKTGFFFFGLSDLTNILHSDVDYQFV